MAPASVLSPLAEPFFPSEPDYNEQTGAGNVEYATFGFDLASLGFAIYNDGSPSLVPVEGNHVILRGISDEAIDEIFPPTAEEAAEIEAAEDFVSTLANLSALEEREERFRTGDLSFLLEKRWEVRRSQVLRSKVLRNRSNALTSVDKKCNDKEKTLIVFNKTKPKHDPSHFEGKHKTQDRTPSLAPRSAKGLHGHAKFVHQPRKHC